MDFGLLVARLGLGTQYHVRIDWADPDAKHALVSALVNPPATGAVASALGVNGEPGLLRQAA